MPFFDDEAHCKEEDSEAESFDTNDYDFDDSFIASENSGNDTLSESSVSHHSVEPEIKRKEVDQDYQVDQTLRKEETKIQKNP